MSSVKLPCACGTTHIKQSSFDNCSANKSSSGSSSSTSPIGRYSKRGATRTDRTKDGVTIDPGGRVDENVDVVGTHVGFNAALVGTDTHVKDSDIGGFTTVRGGTHNKLTVEDGTEGEIVGGPRTSGLTIAGGPFKVEATGDGPLAIQNTRMAGRTQIRGSRIKVAGSTLTAPEGQEVELRGAWIGVNRSDLEGDMLIGERCTIDNSTVRTDSTVTLNGAHIVDGNIQSADQVSVVGYGYPDPYKRQHQSATIYPSKKTGRAVAAIHDMTTGKIRTVTGREIRAIRSETRETGRDATDKVLFGFSAWDMDKMEAEMDRIDDLVL